MIQVQAEELNNIWILTKLEESLGRDLWTQNLTLILDAATTVLQEIRDLLRETHDQTSRTQLAECRLVEPSLAELSLAKLSLAELSRDQLAEYD